MRDDLEPACRERARVGQRLVALGGRLDVLHRTAPHAHGVVVAVDVGIEARGVPEAVDAYREAEPDEALERAVDGCTVDLRKMAPDLLEHVLGRWMVAAPEERLEHGATLAREREARFAAALGELGKASAFALRGRIVGVARGHGAKCTRLRTIRNEKGASLAGRLETHARTKPSPKSVPRDRDRNRYL